MRAAEAVSAARLEVLVAADVRFPLERANGVQIVKTAAALAQAGVATTLLVRHSDPRPTDEVLALYGVAPHAGLSVRRLRVRHRRGSFRLARALYLLRATLAAALALRRGALVLTRDLQLADLLLALPLPRRVLYEAHAVEELMYRERGALYGTGERPDERKAARLYAREGRVWRRAAGFVSTTTGIQETFVERYGARAAPSVVVANGGDAPRSPDFPGLPSAPPLRVLYAGQLYPWKGVDVLVAAAARAPRIALTILGGLAGERDLPRVRALVEQLGLSARVELLGTVPQARVRDELQRAAVVAVPFLRTAMTERHTSPLKAFEAMTAGRAIVASDLPSSREVLQHEHTALLVPAGDVDAWAAALERLAGDAGLVERLARAAFAQAARYAWDTRAQALLALFRELAA
jgi:glycosyltransferase involved in cell wall biosynthesis